RELNQIFRGTCISREHDRMALVVDPVAQGGLHRSVIHQKSRDFYTVVLIDQALVNVFPNQPGSLTRYLFVNVPAHVLIEGVSLLKMFEHVDSSRRTPNLQRDTPSH